MSTAPEAVAPISEGRAADLPSHLPRLTSTRALAALTVFVFHLAHYDVIDRQPVGFAYSMLAYFFVLSGFVLTWSTRLGTPLRTYYRRRAARVWPNHLVLVAVALVVPVTVHDPTWPAVLASLFLVQTWVPDGDVLFGLNAVSWSLSVEVAFYAVLPFVVPRLARLAPKDRWLVAGGVFVASSCVVLSLAHAGGNLSTVAYAFPPLRAGEFMLGCVAALEVRRGWRLSGRAALCLVGGSLLAVATLPTPLPTLNVLLTPLWLAVIVRCVQADITGRRSLLTTRWAVYAGDLSFAFYLVHDLVILNLAALDLAPASLCALMLAASTAAAALLHHAVEKPAQRRLSHPRRRSPDISRD